MDKEKIEIYSRDKFFKSAPSVEHIPDVMPQKIIDNKPISLKPPIVKDSDLDDWFGQKLKTVPQETLAKLANLYEPALTDTLPEQKRRFATCAGCSRYLIFGMWHCWLRDGGFYKEIHLCGKCWNKYAV